MSSLLALRHFHRASVAAVCLALLGCGLSDYEARMDASREYIARYDEENKILNEVIDQPSETVNVRGKDETREVWPFVVMLRLPRGISGTLSDKKQRLSPAFPLYVFSGADSYVYVAAGTAVEKTDTKTGALSTEDFRKGALDAIATGYYFRQGEKFFSKPPALTPEKVTKQPNPLRRLSTAPPPLTFEALTFQAMNTNRAEYQFQLYHLRQDVRQVIVIYQIPLARTGPDTNKAIDMSLKTLNIGDRAAALRAETIQMNQRRPR